MKEKEIRVGGIFDLTGPTSETGNHYAEGIKDYIHYLNSKGGINRKKIRLFSHDSAYVTSRHRAAYETLTTENHVHLMFGWGTGSSEELMKDISRDEIPYTSVSYSEILGDPEYAPYNFLTSVSYSDQIGIILAFIKKNGKNAGRPPRVAILHNETQFGFSPLKAADEFARKNGIEIVAKEVVTLEAQEAFEQLEIVKEKKADYVIIQETAWATSVILKNAQRMKLDSRFVGLIWSGDDKLIALAGKDSEGFISVFPVTYQDSSLPGMKAIFNYYDEINKKRDKINFRYINGWVTAMIMFEGVRRAGDDLSGLSIKNALEKIKNFDTGGLTYPVSFSPESHKGLIKLKIGKVHQGSWKMITDFVDAEDLK
ncbi:MAG TPA: ABC transporter substrate-binding protein [Spirochaetota bacterium]|nr:ABC transporter substrate-binding protein [Spirochaetota bacterium]HPR48779.1 ABC transporter substrate-binding protein [Spirochaetota bacterium]